MLQGWAGKQPKDSPLYCSEGIVTATRAYAYFAKVDAEHVQKHGKVCSTL